jgi:hypothetical protein
MAIIDARRTAQSGAVGGVDRSDAGEGVEAFIAIQGNVMALLLLEALGALLLLVFIVWWTMFSGRKNGELKDSAHPPAPEAESDRK